MASRPFFDVLNHRFRVGCSINAHSARMWAAAARSRVSGGGALGIALALGPDPLEFSLDPLDGLVAVVAVALFLGGVVADDEAPSRGMVELDLLDTQVAADLLVAALPGEYGLDQVTAGTHVHLGDVVATGTGEAGQVVRGGETAVDHGDHEVEPPVANVVLGPRQDRLVAGPVGHTQHRTGTPSLVTASPMVICGRSSR
ncbi:hypothetical protein [Streptomyces sp. GC420]|uniref:hypothetical protein n=1 Tax=Streptomyces sp. GC420 TaxID=2697568 RepID=UPI001414E51E|nr:hypothetical protein [Streptomyces sp. GC420]NBM14213.1 hypothetical protein [Streptomyces sp. GC420]